MPQHKCEQAITCEATSVEKTGLFTLYTWKEKEYKIVARYEGGRLKSIDCERKDYSLLFSSVLVRYMMCKIKANELDLLDFSKQDYEFAYDWIKFVKDYYAVRESFVRLGQCAAQLKIVAWLLVEEYYLESNV